MAENKYLEDMTPEEKLAIIRRDGSSQENILTILLDLQNCSKTSSIDEDTARLVAEELGMTETKVFEVITFYAMLETKPQGRFVIELCKSTPCHYTGSDKVAEMLREELGIGMGETTSDGMFSTKFVPCMGACDIGPVFKIKDKVYGNLDREKVHSIIAELRASVKEAK